MICEIKHYPGEDLPYGMWVDNEFIGSYVSMQEAAAEYERMLKGRAQDPSHILHTA